MGATEGERPAQERPAQERKPWEQMPGEPDRWYGRFQVYLELGITRTVQDALRAAGVQKRNAAYTNASGWGSQGRRWHWRERAQAWDVHQRELLALSERNARIALRSRRVARMEDYLDAVCEVLDNAHMTQADEKLAREWLPQMRVFLRDLLVAERQEYERGDIEHDDASHEFVITADDMRAAQRLLEAQEQESKSKVFDGPVGVDRRLPFYPLGKTLCVCVGPEEGLMLDLAALRAVRAATGLQFLRILNVTRQKFTTTLRRERLLGRQLQLLHIALHASAAGIEFVDGVADGNWLSERLDGVRVLLLASCACDTVGDWLGVVPFVVTLSEEIGHEDAATLTQAFWQNIGLGKEPGEALDEALKRCPPAIGEYVVRHW
jgi:hypothetical protein